MLAKEVCKRCRDRHTVLNWIREDDEQWDYGFVACFSCRTPEIDLPIYLRIDIVPPRECYHKFEHAVVAGSS